MLPNINQIKTYKIRKFKTYINMSSLKLSNNYDNVNVCRK